MLGQSMVASVFTLALSTYLVAAIAVPAAGQAIPEFQDVKIGALDPSAWNGVVFRAQAYNQPANFAFRIGSYSEPNFVDGELIHHAVGEVGPHAPDESYARMGWRNLPRQSLVTLEWSRVDRTTVVGRLRAERGFKIVFESYFPDGKSRVWGGVLSLDEPDHAIVAQRFFNQVFGNSASFLLMTDQPVFASGLYSSLDQLRQNMLASARLNSAVDLRPDAGAAGMEFDTDHSATIHFVAKLGWDKEALLNDERSLLAPGRIDSILEQKAQDYAARRPAITGLFEGSVNAIGNSMFWNSFYVPELDLTFPSISRAWALGWDGYALGVWDCFFDSLLTSLEDKAQTDAQVKAILLDQSSTGVVAERGGFGTEKGISQPPVGSYAVLKEYDRFRDRRMLEWAYPRLKKWHEWWFADRGDGQPWRDGNRDGLLEWGSDRGSTAYLGGGFWRSARWESGMDDSPMWDDTTYDPHTYTMNLDDVGLNSLYAVDSECMAKMASILGKNTDAAEFNKDYVRVRDLMRQRLWNDQDGMYENRYWDGRFSKRISPSNFYPLFAGVATQSQAERMVQEHLLNPKEFWGEYVIPTIARDDPAFSDQFYWRGAIWGPTNYMVYEGLVRYRFDQVAFQFAQKSYSLFMDDWKRNQHDNEQYLAWGGNGGGDAHYTWGTLLCLEAVEQYLDENPWDEGLRFGMLNPGATGELHRISWDGHRYDVAVGPEKTELTRDGQLRFEADAGIVVRNYEEKSDSVSFTVDCSRPVHATTRAFDAGVLQVRIDGKPAGQVRVRSQSAIVSISAGEHQIELRPLSGKPLSRGNISAGRRRSQQS